MEKSEENPKETHKNVTILFADIIGFSPFIKKSPLFALDFLSKLFTNFDKECENLQLFKIYTIGDCYVAMSSADEANRKEISEEASDVVKLGVKMIEIIQKVKDNLDLDLDMRIGIHTVNRYFFIFLGRYYFWSGWRWI